MSPSARIKKSDVKKTVIRLGSGTSGSPHFTIRRATTHDEAPQTILRPMILFGGLSVRLNHVIRRLYLGDPGLEAVVTVDAADLQPSFGDLFADFAPDTLMGTPAFCLRALAFPDRRAISDSKVQLCMLSGEIVSRTKASAIAQKLPSAFISAGYATSETGLIGRSCPHAPLGAYHPVAGTVVRIAGAEDGIGEIVVNNEVIAECNTGDSGRMLDLCPCGQATFEVLGRINFDFIRLCGATLFQEEFERVAKSLSVYLADYRVLAEEVIVEDRMCGKIEIFAIPRSIVRARNDPEGFLSEEFAHRLSLTPTRTLADLIEERLFLPLSVTFVDSFPQQSKEVKMRLKTP